MFQSYQNHLERLISQRKPGQTIAAIVTMVSLLGIVGLFSSRSNNLLYYTICSVCAYLGFIRWITFRRPVGSWLAPGLFCIVWVIPLFRLFLGAGGGPVSWDEMLYMDLARTASAEPRVLNQYFHIYLIKIFYWLAGTSDFSAARYYWIAVQTTVLVLIYQSTIILTRRFSIFSRILSGMAAVLLFAAQPLVLEFIGVAYVDFTLELLLTSTIFLFILNDAHPSLFRLSMVVLGVLFGLGLKTKEVAIVLFIPAISLVWMNRPSTSLWRFYLKSAGLYAIGGFISLMLLIVLNTIILGQPLWGFTPHDLQAWFTARTGADPGLIPFIRQNYFTELSSTASLCCLVLIAAILFQRNESLRSVVYKILLAVTISFILFYSFIPFQAYTRYLIPVYPLLAILAGPAIAELTRGSTSLQALLMLTGIPSALLVWFIKQNILPDLDPEIYTSYFLYTSLILPILLCVSLITWVVLPSQIKYWKTVLVGVWFIAVVLYPVSDITHSLAVKQIDQQVTERFKTIRLWNPDVYTYGDRQIFMSERISNPQGRLAISADYARIMLNLYYDVNLPTAIVTTQVDDFLQHDLNRYCFGLISVREYKTLSDEDRRLIEENFTVTKSKNQLLTYLTNPACK